MVGTFPASSHSPIAYAGALFEASVNPDAADFLSYLTVAGGDQDLYWARL